MKNAVLGMVLLGAANMAFAATTSTSVSDVVAPAEASVSTSAAAVKATESQWSGSVFGSMIIGTSGANRGDVANSTSGDAYVQFKRRLDADRSIALRGVFLRAEGSEALAFYDPYVLFTFSPFMGSTIRTNIPMSAWSREIGRHELRYDGVLELAKAGKATLSWATNPRAYGYSQNRDGQVSFRWQNDVALSYELNEKALAYFEVGYEARWYHSGKGQGFEDFNSDKAAKDAASKRFMRLLEVGFEFTPVEGVWVAPYVAQGNIRGTQFELFNDDELNYMLEVSASL